MLPGCAFPVLSLQMLLQQPAAQNKVISSLSRDGLTLGLRTAQSRVSHATVHQRGVYRARFQLHQNLCTQDSLSSTAEEESCCNIKTVRHQGSAVASVSSLSTSTIQWLDWEKSTSDDEKRSQKNWLHEKKRMRIDAWVSKEHINMQKNERKTKNAALNEFDETRTDETMPPQPPFLPRPPSPTSRRYLQHSPPPEAQTN